MSEHSFDDYDDPNRVVDLYHRTTQEAALQIMHDGAFTSRENTEEAFTSNRIMGQAEGYGEAVVHLRIPAGFASLDDEFPGGEAHYRVPLDRAQVVEAFLVDAEGRRSALGQAPVDDLEHMVSSSTPSAEVAAPGESAINRGADQEFIDRVEAVTLAAVEKHSIEDRPVEEIFSELAIEAGIVDSQLRPSGIQEQHLARLETVRQELNAAIEELHSHDPQTVRENRTPEEVQLAERTQEIPLEDPSQLRSSDQPGSPEVPTVSGPVR